MLVGVSVGKKGEGYPDGRSKEMVVPILLKLSFCQHSNRNHQLSASSKTVDSPVEAAIAFKG
jgi:hypothetical protein